MYSSCKQVWRGIIKISLEIQVCVFIPCSSGTCFVSHSQFHLLFRWDQILQIRAHSSWKKESQALVKGALSIVLVLFKPPHRKSHVTDPFISHRLELVTWQSLLQERLDNVLSDTGHWCIQLKSGLQRAYSRISWDEEEREMEIRRYTEPHGMKYGNGKILEILW